MFGKKKQKEEYLRSMLTNFAMVSGFGGNAKLIKEDIPTFGMSIAYILGASYSYAEPLGLSPYEAINNAFKVYCVSIKANPKEIETPFQNVNIAIVHDESVRFVTILGAFISAKFLMEDYDFVDMFKFLVNWDYENVRILIRQMEIKYETTFENEIKDDEIRYQWLGI